jgi:ferredoxin
MRVHVDADVCQGHGVCCALCPDVFELSDDGYAEVVSPDVPEHLEADVRAAVGQCPARAISVD